MAQKWISGEIGGGVVLTRQNTALRNGELQQASFVRMLPGNREQLYPDLQYTHINLALSELDEVVDSFYMNFEGGLTYLVVVCTPISRLGYTNAGCYVFDLSDLSSESLTPVMVKSFPSTVKSATLVNRGAEYFFSAAITEQKFATLDIGEQFIFYIDDNGDLATRPVGLAKSGLTAQVERSIPSLSANLWQRERQSGAPDIGPGPAYTARIAVYNHLYGSYANLVDEWPTPADRNNALGEGFGALQPTGIRLDSGLSGIFDGQLILKHLFRDFVDVSKITLSLQGQGYVFGYWCTEYRTDFGVESGPSDLQSAVSGDPQSAIWEVETDVLTAFESGSPNWVSFVQYVKDNRGFFGITGNEVLVLDEGLQSVRLKLEEAYRSGAMERYQIGRFPLSEAQKEGLVNRVTIDGQSNGSADEVRLYRQNLGFFTDYQFDWLPNVLSPEQGESVGEGNRHADDIRKGRVNRQGGLLLSFPQSELPKDLDDNLLESGVADPGLPYPTIAYVTRGGLGIYDYFRRPFPPSACANMAQSLLRVEHHYSDDALGRNLIVVSPVEDPEQAPAIYSIPVVTDRQDEVIDIRSIRDSAIVFTTTSALFLNYIPFDGNNQQDRVLTQLTGNHGVADNRRGVAVDSNSGQLFVWLSQTSLMATDGRGVWDICPDFSVETAKGLGFEFSRPILVNNAKEHRLELWTGGARWDFLYHRSQLKDIRGDGAGLSMKLLGPTQWYPSGDDRSVRSACSGVLDDVFRTFHIVDTAGGSKTLAVSSDSYDGSRPFVMTRKLMGSDPTSRIRSKRVGLQHGSSLGSLRVGVVNTSPSTQSDGGGTTDTRDVKLDLGTLFSDGFISDGFGSSGVYTAEWSGDAAGPMWVQVEEAQGGSGR